MKQWKWISVKDELPPTSVRVLVWHRHRKTWLSATRYPNVYRSKKYHWNYYDVDGSNMCGPEDITHWMFGPDSPNNHTSSENKE